MIRINRVNVHQGVLSNCITSIFPPSTLIQINARKDVNLQSTIHFEFDIWIPSFQLALEFQDPHHFINAWYSHHPLSSIKEKDNIKNEAIRKQERTLILVPCWWDGKHDSLIATILFSRPDLQSILIQSQHVQHDRDDRDDRDRDDRPIHLNPSSHLFREFVVPGVGELMLSSSTIWVNKFFSTMSPNQWWMGEKYDGVRCCWNPKDKTLYTRHGAVFPVPSIIIDSVLVHKFLDGEVWCGREYFPETHSLLENPFNVPFVRMIVFDDAGEEARNKTFECRYVSLLSSFPSNHPLLTIAMRRLCVDKNDIQTTMCQITNEGGEGVMIRKLNSLYHPGRSSSLHKFKTVRNDSEALVVKVGNKNSDGSTPLLLRLPDARTFTLDARPLTTTLGSSRLPRAGDVVTYSCDQFTRQLAIPVNPELVRIRSDLEWRDVVDSYSPSRFVQLSDNDAKMLRRESFRALSGRWVRGEGSADTPEGRERRERERVRVRKFLELVARSKGLDPLLPDTWYSMSKHSISLAKGSTAMLAQLKGARKAISFAFPDLSLDPTRFIRTSRGYLDDPKNHKKILENFARSKNMDPLVADNWYTISLEDQIRLETSNWLVKYYKRELKNALKELFSVDIDSVRLPRRKRLHWPNRDSLKRVLLEFAKQKNFDPLVAANWNSVNINHMKDFAGGKRLFYEFKGSMVDVLLYYFPNIGIEKHNIGKRRKDYYHDASVLKYYFDEYAVQNQFDPLIPTNWYSASFQNYRSKHFRGIVNCFGPIATALTKAYPSIGLEWQYFSDLFRADSWQEKRRR